VIHQQVFLVTVDAGLPYPHNISDTPANILILEKQVANDFSAALFDVQMVVSQRERLDFVWPLWEIFENKTTKSMKVVDAFIEPIVADAISKMLDERRRFLKKARGRYWITSFKLPLISRS